METGWVWYETNRSPPPDWASEGLPLCHNCQPGQFREKGCQNCPAGFYTHTSTEANRAFCQSCKPGYYSSDERTISCSACPTGFYQNDEGKITCTKCLSGTFQSRPGKTQCQDCPVGYAQTLEGRGTCDSCAKGKYSNELKSMQCKKCVAGQYQTTEGSSTCQLCSSGKASSTEGLASECPECSAGRYQGLQGQTSCVGCQVGTYLSSTGSAGPCDSCPSGRFQSFEGRSQCYECNGGYICNVLGLGAECPAGHYLPAGEWSTGCLACPAEHQPNGARTACLSCPSGKSTSGHEGSTCQDCPANGMLNVPAWNGFSYRTTTQSYQSCLMPYNGHTPPYCAVAAFNLWYGYGTNTYKTWVISLEDQTTYARLSDMDDLGKITITKNGVQTASITVQYPNDGTVSQTWQQGDYGTFEFSCTNYAWDFNCEFLIFKKTNGFILPASFEFFSSDPGSSSYCANN